MIVSANSNLEDCPPNQVESWVRLKTAPILRVEGKVSYLAHTQSKVGSIPTLCNQIKYGEVFEWYRIQSQKLLAEMMLVGSNPILATTWGCGEIGSTLWS